MPAADLAHTPAPINVRCKIVTGAWWQTCWNVGRPACSRGVPVTFWLGLPDESPHRLAGTRIWHPDT